MLGERGILAKKEAREREEKKFARCASIIPGGPGGVFRLEKNGILAD